jgi:CubicO group peptidase (beta-lactamase class C family)
MGDGHRTLDALRALLHEDVEQDLATGFAVAVRRRGKPTEHVVIGVDGAGRPLAADCLFPVASITKLALALALLRLSDAGRLAASDDLAKHLPDAAAAVPGVTLRSLLAHTAGLPAETPVAEVPYQLGAGWPPLAAACLRIAPVRAPGSAFEYGNVGYGLLGVVVERLTGRSVDAALSELVFDPLAVEAYLGVEPPRTPAAVSGLSGQHAGTELEPFNSPFWRSLGLPWGGLVTTAAGALSLVQAFAGEPAGFLRPETIAEATRDQTRGAPTAAGIPYAFMAGPWGLGPELQLGAKPAWSPVEAGPGSFGHAGSSGCVTWAAPAAGVAWAALSGRVMGAPDHWLFTRAASVGRAALGLR